MQIKAPVTGVTAINDIQIQNGISHLLILKTGGAAITDEKMTLVLKTEGQSKNVFPLVKIRRPAVISQYGQGYQLIEVTDDDPLTINSAFLIDVSGGQHAVSLENGEYLSLDLTDLVSGATYSVFGIESPLRERSYREYNSQVIDGGESQLVGFNVDPATASICLSNNDALANIRLTFFNGNQATFTPTELNALMRNGNDIAFAADTMVEGGSINQTINGGGAEFWLIPANGVTRFEITTIGGVDLTLITIAQRSY